MPHVQAAEASTIAPTREMALDLLAAEIEGARDSEASNPQKSGERPSPFTPGDTPANSDLHPFLTGEETRPERARGPLSARLGGTEWEVPPWDQPERPGYGLPLTSSPLPPGLETPECSDTAQAPASPGRPASPATGSGRLGGRLSANRVPPESAGEARSPEGTADDEAEIAALRALLAERPNDPTVLRKLGFVLARKGQLDAAAEVYRKAREGDPGS